jgi:hypothetical protein
VQTLARPARLKRLLDYGVTFRVAVIDEAHHAAADTYQRVMVDLGLMPADVEERKPGASPPDMPLVMGFTATAQRADDLDLGDTFEEIVYYRSLPSMIRDGYLCDLRGIQVKLARFNPNALHTRGGDYIDSEAADALEQADVAKHTVGAWQRHASDRKTLVFTPTIALAQILAAAYQDAGVAAECVSGVDIEERRRILRRFAAGTTRVVTNAQVLTEGYDQPDIGCVVIAKPTKSQVAYSQMVGRGTRTYLDPETMEQKVDCLIMDMVGVTDRLDLVTLPKMLGMGEARSETLDELDGATVAGGESFLDYQRRMIEDGRIVAKQVDLFNRQALAWLCVKPGLWTLDLSGEAVTLEQRADGLWDVRSYRGSSVTPVASQLTQDFAMGTAEDYARSSTSFVAAFVDKNAKWRGKPASLGQAVQLRKWRASIPPCPACSGTGGQRIGECRDCEGTGFTDAGADTVRRCKRCAGDGREPGDCRKCRGSGTALSAGEASDLIGQAKIMRQRRRVAT